MFNGVALLVWGRISENLHGVKRIFSIDVLSQRNSLCHRMGYYLKLNFLLGNLFFFLRKTDLNLVPF